MFVVVHSIVQSMNDVFLFESMFIILISYAVRLRLYGLIIFGLGCVGEFGFWCVGREIFCGVSGGVRVMGVGVMTLLFKLLI